LLVAAFIGETWKSAYKHAVDRGYRFLSYGDRCLFIPEPAGE
jgi:S-adenosylmethionine:tRNA ribosyltransferase-isomerase